MNETQEWFDRLAVSMADSGQCRLTGRPVVDCQAVPQFSGYPGHPCGDVAPAVRQVTQLVSVRASARVRFQLPLADLPQGHRVLFAWHDREGLWLAGPGIDEQDPQDLVAAIFEHSQACGLRRMVLAEMAGQPFTRLSDWRSLCRGATLWCCACRTQGRSDGLWCEVDVDLEASI